MPEEVTFLNSCMAYTCLLYWQEERPEDFVGLEIPDRRIIQAYCLARHKGQCCSPAYCKHSARRVCTSTRGILPTWVLCSGASESRWGFQGLV